MKRAIFLTLGALLILVGIVGLFLPILQGWAMIFAGLALVSPRLARRLRGRLFRQFFKNPIVPLDQWKKRGIQAGFTTKRFPLFLRKTDDLMESDNQRKFSALLQRNRFALLSQVHGDGVAVLDDPQKYTKDGFYHFKESDAAVTRLPGMTLLVLSADCLPIFLWMGDWVGLVHAGWRGSQKKIVQKTVKLLLEKTGRCPENIHAIFGPCVSAKHYEVGPEFKGYFPPASIRTKNERCYFDLARENGRQLIEAGVPARHIIHQDVCTVEENETFYSFRMEKEKAGRIVSFISRY